MVQALKDSQLARQGDCRELTRRFRPSTPTYTSATRGTFEVAQTSSRLVLAKEGDSFVPIERVYRKIGMTCAPDEIVVYIAPCSRAGEFHVVFRN